MFAPNVQRVLGLIGPNDVVLDIGAWACPFNRANYVVDAEPYETRGYYKTVGGVAYQGPAQESFNAQTWVQRDICSREPFPFADKSIDFVICSHTLEDLRDPLWVCSEIIRVGKRGYIEMPSRNAESSRGWEDTRIAGLGHHRWLAEIRGNSLEFFHKHHSIHSHWRYSLPPSYLRALPPDGHIQFLFWEDRFAYQEVVIHGDRQVRSVLASYVESVQPYPKWRVKAAEGYEQVHGQVVRVLNGIRRRLPGASRAQKV